MTFDEQSAPASGAVPSWLNQSKHTGKTPNQATREPSVAVLGGALPPVGDIPVLTDVIGSIASAQGVAPTANSANSANARPATVISADGKIISVSSFEEGWIFRGTATINGSCTIAGIYEGQIFESDAGEANIVVSPTGVLNGDVSATSVSIMGRYSGTLDASGGRVDLHASSVIAGHVRYGQLQVNGADLNATLERVPVRGKKQP